MNTIEINPASPATHSVIWLHGLGADGNDFAPIVPELHLPPTLAVRFIFPHAPIIPVSINNGYKMRAWFDLYDLSFNRKIDEAGILKSVQYLEQLIAQEEARGIPSEHIVLAGFSQGAVIALCTGLTCQKPLAGIMALSGYLPLNEPLLAQRSEVNATIPIFIAHGTEDDILPYALGEQTYRALHQANYPLTWRSYPMPHSVCPAEIKDIHTWLVQILTKHE